MDKTISVIGMPMDLGQARRGVDMGPSAIRYAHLIERLSDMGYTVEDLGDIPINREKIKNDEELKNLNSVLAGNEKLAQKVNKVIEEKKFPLVLGGDHSIAIGTLAGTAKHYDNLGVIWYDAHGDLNTLETSPSGNIHGMPLAVSLGIGHESLVNLEGYAPKIKPETSSSLAPGHLMKGSASTLRKAA